MNNFFDDNVLLQGNASKDIYKVVKNLPIIDYHCHLNQYMIRDDAKFDGIGDLWLAGGYWT